MSTLSASDLTHLTRLASSMPEGSVQRRAILTALRDHRAEPKTAGLNKKALIAMTETPLNSRLVRSPSAPTRGKNEDSTRGKNEDSHHI